MSLRNLAELVGSLLVLSSFLALQAGRLSRASVTYLSLNMTGSCVLAWIALDQGSWGFLLLEGVWAGASAASLATVLRRHG